MNHRPFSIFTVILFSGMLVSSLLLPNAVAHGGVDQSFTGPFTTGSGFGPASQMAGQTFTPMVNNIIAVDLFIWEINGNAASDTVTVNIRDGGVSGTILDTKIMVVNINAGTSITNPQVVHFNFNTNPPITLTPGQTYGIQFESASDNILLASASGVNPYLGGAAFQQSAEITGFDWGFATYFSEDFIPSQPIGGELLSINTTALLLAGVQTNLGWIIPVVISAVGISAFLVKRKF